MLYLLHLYREEIQSKTMVNDLDNETNNIVVTGKTLTKMIKIIEVYIVVATLFGFLVYMGQKKFEYKNKFNYMEFLFGHVICKQDSPDLSIIQSLKHTFD
jgi:F0F1-type ATP synthase alpha subunit